MAAKDAWAEPLSICILSLSAIPDDPRVRRQGDAFHKAGWKVTAVSVPGWKSAAPPWRVIETRFEPWFSEAAPGSSAVGPIGPDRYLEVPEVRRFYDSARHIHADIYLANDWHMLPPAMRLAREHGTYFAYDTHEYALEEYKYNPGWRLTLRPMAEAVERIGLRGALVASTVSSGIARDMAKEHRLERPILVFRNTPAREDVAFKPCGERIDVLYHGIIVQDRGLEDCVRSVRLWRREFRLILRGPGEPAFRAGLERIAETEGVRERVVFAPPVPMLELVRAAATADIGISTPPKTSKHNIYALPNKFFEYIQAGLALCVCDLPDMAEIVKQYNLGLLISELSPQSIAEAINRFDRQSIDAFKRNSLKAARDLNWDVESVGFVKTYEQAITAARSAGRGRATEIQCLSDHLERIRLRSDADIDRLLLQRDSALRALGEARAEIQRLTEERPVRGVKWIDRLSSLLGSLRILGDRSSSNSAIRH